VTVDNNSVFAQFLFCVPFQFHNEKIVALKMFCFGVGF